jgi:hypothetical protein
MDKYYVYCLKNSGEVVYIGSTTKIIDRIKKHKRDKQFDEVLYAEMPDEKTMLEVEGYGISKKDPLLNRSRPRFSIKEIPDFVQWKRANLDFLRYSDVDWNQNILIEASYDYLFYAMRELGIPAKYYNMELCYMMCDGKPIAVFDGTGFTIDEFIKQQGFNKEQEYVRKVYDSHGKIPASWYFESVEQFKNNS